ncbi:MAG: bifunctional phosphopantothenoylcysteine decarboxylase/phosphopantothenate--cysteine ligase CoaBC, partial [Synergistetes bacterium HGW-Synergistetes-2]
APAAGFGADTNTVRILSADGSVSEFAGIKEDVAEEIWNTVLADKQLS